jgi:CHAT domain-containing protein/tetratricopeptide (TPR) repeat protein
VSTAISSRFFLRISVALIFLGLPPRTLPQNTDDVGRIDQSISRFFSAYAAKDLAAILALWDPQSADFISATENFRRTFGANRIVESGIGTPRTTVHGDTARSFIEATISAVEIRTGRPQDGFGKAEKLFDWKRVNGAWALERYGPVEQELADELIAAKTAAERSAYLAARRPLATPELVRLLSRTATEKGNHGDTKEGLRISDLAIETATGLGDSPQLGWALLQKASLLFDTADYPAALALAQRALALFQQAKDPRGEAGARLNIANVYTATSQKDAIAEYEESLKLSRGLDSSLESKAVGNLGEVYRRRGFLNKALAYGKASLQIAEEMNDRRSAADSMNNVADVWLAKGDFDTALGTLNECLAINRELGDPGAEAVTLGNIGVAYEATARYEEALKTFETSLDLKRKVGDREGEAMTLNNIGIVMMETTRYDEALARYEESYALASSIHSPRLQSEARANIGGLYRLKGNYRLALVNLNQALKIDQDAHERAAEAQTLSTIAGVYSETGRSREALSLFQQTILIFHAEGMKMEEAMALNDIGNLRTARRLYAAAEADFQKSLAIRTGLSDLNGKSDTLTSLANLYRLEGKLEQSAKSARQSIGIAQEIESPAQEAAAHLTLAQTLHALKRPADSREEYQAALALADSAGNPETSIAARTGLGRLDMEGKNWLVAAEECGKAIAEIERVRFAAVDPMLRLGYADRQSDSWNCRVTSLLALNRNEDALQTAESAKAKSLLDTMGGSKSVDKGLTQAEKDQADLLEAKVVKLSSTLRDTSSSEVYQRLIAAKRAADDLRRDLRLRHAPVSAQTAVGEPIALAETAALLPDSTTALLEYAIGKEESYLFVIRRPSDSEPPALCVVRLGIGRDRLRLLARNFHEGLDKQAIEMPEARLLYDALIAPTETALAGVRTLGVVPGDNMWTIPFAALKDRAGHFLVERRATFYAPSLTALRAMDHLADSRRPEAAPSVLLIGNPYLGASHTLTLPLTGTFRELPKAEREVNLIAAMGRKRGLPVELRTGTAATESVVKSQWGAYTVIHLATHAFYDDLNSLYSGIVLAQVRNDKAEDGILEAREIVEQDLRASLVVLSSCDTARGAEYAGEVPVGLSWALFVAGTPASLVTQWKVADESTATLMQGFYRRWGFGIQDPAGTTKFRALQLAQKDLLGSKSYSHPHYWASFTLIGDPR